MHFVLERVVQLWFLLDPVEIWNMESIFACTHMARVINGEIKFEGGEGMYGYCKWGNLRSCFFSGSPLA